MKVSTWAILILVNVLWAINPTMTKVIMESHTPLQAAWLRYFFAFLGVLAILAFQRPKPAFAIPSWDGRGRVLWLYLLLLGFFAFSFTSALNSLGLSHTRATDNALIIAIEPLVTVLMARLIVGEKIKREHGFAIVLAVIGFSLLSDLSLSNIKEGISGSTLGNLLILVSLLGEGGYSAYSRKLLPHFSPIAIFSTGISIGILILTILLFMTDGLPVFPLNLRTTLASIQVGFIGTAFTYLYWLIAMKTSTIPAMVITLFVQPLAGAVFGTFLLHEHLTGSQWIGGGLILLSLLAPLLKWSGSKNSLP